jgi:crotonobetainyl-CoA:carnitine CoA-transferase CaiB-like acyl-CoA transferase
MLLNGIRVINFCHFLQGPAGAQYLGDMGADVIKVEPLTGAHERRWSGADVFVEGISGFYLCANRNNRSVGIDLKHPDGVAVARKLIASADVVMENFRPGVFAKLGFDDATLKSINPNLIYASASGFGSSGPMATQPGQDLLIQARSGLMSVTGTPGMGPTAVGAAVVDQHGGALFALGILGALVKKLRTGQGTRVEASLLNSGLDLQQEPLVNYFAGSLSRDKLNRAHNLATWFHAAPYGVYAVKDGHVVISLNDMQNLSEALESDNLASAASLHPYQDRDEYARILAIAVKKFSLVEIERRFDARSVWWAPIKYYDQLLEDPQMKHLGVFRTVEVRGRTIHLVNHPNRYDGQIPELRMLALEIGEHTWEVLEEAGYAQHEIKELLEKQAIAASRNVGSNQC